MEIKTYHTRLETSEQAALLAADLLVNAIAQKGRAVFVAATGASQFDFLAALARQPGIDWSRTAMYHLDEYVGLPMSHPASFRRYLMERLVEKVAPGEVNLIQGDAPDLPAELASLNALIAKETVDVAFVGIGENGHLAFNDPPADFEIEQPYILVNLDEACRRQQLGEGWFPSLADVPDQAISMSIRQIMKSRAIVCTVPDARKALPVRDCFTGPVTPLHPASILREHPACTVFLDDDSAALLKAAGG